MRKNYRVSRYRATGNVRVTIHQEFNSWSVPVRDAVPPVKSGVSSITFCPAYPYVQDPEVELRRADLSSPSPVLVVPGAHYRDVSYKLQEFSVEHSVPTKTKWKRTIVKVIVGALAFLFGFSLWFSIR